MTKKRVWTKPKGHWPAGKPRHRPIAPARLARVRAWFERHRQTWGANERSIAPVAAAIGVSDRTLRRWLSGEDHPDPERWRDLMAHLETLGF